jgi:hypothetical protein
MRPFTVENIKLAIVELTGLSKDTLHVYVGLGVFFAVAAVSPKRLRSVIPLSAVFAVAFAGELLDIVDKSQWRLLESAHDLLNTLFWPSAIWLLARSDILFITRTGRNGDQ